jgi:collagen type III alpha
MKKISILTALLLGLGTAAVLAEDAPGNRPDKPRGGAGGPGGPGGARPNPEEIFKRLDKNGDGKIAKDEAPERIAANFDKLDVNKDGFITPEELKAGRPGGPGGPDAPRRPAAGGGKQ